MPFPCTSEGNHFGVQLSVPVLYYKPPTLREPGKPRQDSRARVSLRQAVWKEQREYNRAEFVDPVSSRSFGRSHPVTKNATAFLRLLDEQMSVN